MNEPADVLVIGGGPCGLLAALTASEKRKVLLLEKPDKHFSLGKRILVSGNGRSNFFNEELLHGERKEEAEGFLSYLSSLGFSYYQEGKLFYPFYNRSECLQSLLLKAVSRNKNIKVIPGEALFINKKTKDAVFLSPEKRKETVSYRDLVLCTGGRSYDRKDFSYGLLKSVGLPYALFSPCLCPVAVKEKIPSYLKNARMRGVLSLSLKDQKIFEESGEVLFKEDGLSGIAVFDSTVRINDVLREDPYSKDSLTYTLDYLSHDGTRIDDTEGKNSLPLFLSTYLEELHYPYGKPLSFSFLSLYPFLSSQISYGGVLLDSISRKTNQALDNDSLYLGGEVLDQNFPCGGYNMGSSFLDGWRIGKALLSK
ncbi:MAG: NAD(P)/FAD-dependent oxidoreductase [Bacilli bacterium]